MAVAFIPPSMSEAPPPWMEEEPASHEENTSVIGRLRHWFDPLPAATKAATLGGALLGAAACAYGLRWFAARSHELAEYGGDDGA